MPLSQGVVVGVYGISGAGKSHALAQIAEDRMEWRVSEGSKVIEEVLRDRGLTMQHFQNELDHKEKSEVRKAAIDRIRKLSGVTVLAGHCSFPKAMQPFEKTPTFEDVFSSSDQETYDAIFYLEKCPRLIFDQRKNDSTRARSDLSVETLELWMRHEKDLLQANCQASNIRFEVVRFDNDDSALRLLDRIMKTVVIPAAQGAQQKSEEALRRSVRAEIPEADTYLLIDGDRTFCPQDTGELFFEKIDDAKISLKQIFKRYPQYSFQAFWEAALLYEKVLPRPEYLRLSEEVGKNLVHIHHSWACFLSQLPETVHPILVSSSNREIWQAVLCAATSKKILCGLQRMDIIAGNNVSLHSYLVDDNAKAIVAQELRKKWAGCRILSFGDSIIDLPMFYESDRAFIVIDDRNNRSLKNFIVKAPLSRGGGKGWLYQLSPSKQEARFHYGIPTATLDMLLKELKSDRTNVVIDFCEANSSARVLASQTRNANLSALELQKIHKRTGQYLAERLLDMYGEHGGLVRNSTFQHVQGGEYSGKETTSSHVLLLALMRGGEPMARGLYKLFPSSHFIHYNNDQQQELMQHILKAYDAKDTIQVILADSVVNSGTSIRRALDSVFELAKSVNPALKISAYVLTIVMQKEAAETLPVQYPRVRFLALRISENKYVGRGGTDTGNRLFGTSTAP